MFHICWINPLFKIVVYDQFCLLHLTSHRLIYIGCDQMFGYRCLKCKLSHIWLYGFTVIGLISDLNDSGQDHQSYIQIRF